MPNKITNRNPYVQLTLTLILGACVGLLTVAFVHVLNAINKIQSVYNAEQPYHLILAPIVLLLLYFIKRNTLFYPSKINEIQAEVSSHTWSPIMAPINFIGPILGHASGMSLGREGAVVLFSAGLVRALKLSWSFWGPVLSTIGFSSIIGNYWVAPFFMTELFVTTSLLQKLYGLLGSVVAILVTQHFQMPHLFSAFEISDSSGFFSKLLLLFLFGAVAGYIMRIYKWLYRHLVSYLGQSGIGLKLLVSILLATFLYLPEFRAYQSLGISQIQDLNIFQGSIVTVVSKLAFTLLATSIGFLGGEFVPLVYSGVHLGSYFFQVLGHSSQLGGAFGAFILFAGATRLKWTSLVIMTAMLGWGSILWIFFVLTVALSFSGPHSLYKRSPLQDL